MFLPTFVWGIAFGAAASTVGFDAVYATFMSAAVWSGTAQMPALGILSQPLFTLFGTSLVVSLRFVPMSLSFGAVLHDRSRLQRALAASMLADASFALVAQVRTNRTAFLAGTWLIFYSSWVFGTLAGALVGPLVPGRFLSLSDALIAAIFAFLTLEMCSNRRLALAAIAAALVAVALGFVVPTGVAILIAAFLTSATIALLHR